MPKRGESATPAQRAAAKVNLAAGQAKRAKMLKDGEGGQNTQDRWAMLIDGRLSVRDLDDAEIRKMRVRGVGGTFAGNARRLPSHLAQQFADERNRRAVGDLGKALPMAIKALKDILDDPDTDAAVKVRVADMIINRNLGKTPETLRVQTDNAWGTMLSEVELKRDLEDLDHL